MKAKNLAYVAAIGMLIICSGIQGNLAFSMEPVTPADNRHNLQKATQSNSLYSISKGIVLVLLAIGIIGVLGVRRKKKMGAGPARNERPKKTSEDRDKAFIALNKEFLNLQYKIARYKFSGDRPPDRLLDEISDIERKVRLISRALE